MGLPGVMVGRWVGILVGWELVGVNVGGTVGSDVGSCVGVDVGEPGVIVGR